MKFGGDAMLLFFGGEQHAEQAAAAGLEMQAAMAEFRRVPVGDQSYRLRMRIAIHSGRFYSASVGQPDGVLHYMLVGDDVAPGVDDDSGASRRITASTRRVLQGLADNCDHGRPKFSGHLYRCRILCEGELLHP